MFIHKKDPIHHKKANTLVIKRFNANLIPFLKVLTSLKIEEFKDKTINWRTEWDLME